MNNNTFSWIPPVHPVIKAQYSHSKRPSPQSMPWVFCDWYGAPEDFWWVRSPDSNTGVNSNTDNHSEPSKTFADTVSITFSPICITGSRVLRKDNFTYCPGWGTWLAFVDWFIEGTGLSAGSLTGRKSPTGFDHHMTLEDRNGKRCGFFAYGGATQGERAQIYLDGAACQVINENNRMGLISSRVNELWRKHEGALKTNCSDLATDIVRFTRVDIAYDDLEGSVGVLDAKAAYLEGQFKGRGLPPRSDTMGINGEDGEWDTGHSRTFRVGSRDSVKHNRSYEKGHQLGDLESPWVRHESEIKHNPNVGYVIPLDILDHTDAYYAGFYEFNRQLLQDVEPRAIARVIAGKVEVTLRRKMEIAKVQCGGLAHALRVLGGWTYEQIGQALVGDKMPRWLDDLAIGDFGAALLNEDKDFTPF